MISKNNVVKILTSDSGEVYDNPKWCLIDPCNYQGSASLCGQEYFGLGESGCKYQSKYGTVTCPKCIEKIKIYQSIKL